MLIIPYSGLGSLNAKKEYHFKNFEEAILYSYDRMIISGKDVGDKVKTSFKIMDTEENFDVSFVVGESEFNPEVKFYIG